MTHYIISVSRTERGWVGVIRAPEGEDPLLQGGSEFPHEDCETAVAAVDKRLRFFDPKQDTLEVAGTTYPSREEAIDALRSQCFPTRLTFWITRPGDVWHMARECAENTSPNRLLSHSYPQEGASLCRLCWST